MADFLINYEHKAREIESVCLIKAELERRGYSVELSCTYDEDRINFRQLYKASVVLTSALYNDDCLYGFVYSIAGVCRKVVNLQWEQALTNQDESDPLFYQNPKGNSRYALHLCWGEEPRRRLLRAGVSPDNAIVVGPIQMDFLRQEFKSFYLTKDELSKQFNLDKKQDWILFISSFTFVNMTEEEYNTELKCMGDRLSEFRDISVNSKRKLIVWLEAALKKHPDRMFIYRPHPSENGDKYLSELESAHKNFRVIGDLNIKQWIKCCDKILTWYSTSAAEVLFAKKSCSILRPVAIPYEWDVSIYRDATMITDIEKFLGDLDNQDRSFPLNRNLIKDYFHVEENTPSYIRICDLLEKVLKSPAHEMKGFPWSFSIAIHLKRLRSRIFFIMKSFLQKIDYRNLFRDNKFLLDRMENHVAVMQRLERDRGKNRAGNAEIKEILFKIQGIINAA